MRDRRFFAVAGLSALCASALLAAPVTRDQLLAMAREKVDPSVMRAIVERDCVDFDVDAANAPELSKTIPPAVLEAAIACRERAPSRPPAGASPASNVGEASSKPLPAPPTAAVPPAPVASAVPAPTRASAPASEASVPTPAPGGNGEIRVRAIFIGESGKLGCACTLDGLPMATLTKEAQGEFGQAVDRSKIPKESSFVPAGAGRHVVAFLCDPNGQVLKVDVDLGAGERRTVEIAESTFRRWKLRKIDEK
jgi:hypothetical protein